MTAEHVSIVEIMHFIHVSMPVCVLTFFKKNWQHHDHIDFMQNICYLIGYIYYHFFPVCETFPPLTRACWVFGYSEDHTNFVRSGPFYGCE